MEAAQRVGVVKEREMRGKTVAAAVVALGPTAEQIALHVH